jgi:Domain of unknown function (DUF3291)
MDPPVATAHPARLAQVNVARLRGDLLTPEMNEFLDALYPINLLAEASPGFVWRLRSAESHGATLTDDDGHLVLVNVSVWTSYEALHGFVYRSRHGAYVRRRARWFLPTPGPTTALWWVGTQDYPTVDDALRRLRHLRAHGATPLAFTLRRRFDASGRPSPGRLGATSHGT